LEIRGDYEALRALAVKVRQSYSPGRRNRPYSLAPCEKGRRRRDAREEDCPARVSTDREGSPVMKRFPVLCLVFLLAGCATHSAVVMGSASYRERMALLPGAVFEVTLEDVTKADAPAEIVGRTRLENPGNPPFDFAIPYDPKRILTNHRYEVRAKIRSGAELLFVTDASYPVLTLAIKARRNCCWCAPRAASRRAAPAPTLRSAPCRRASSATSLAPTAPASAIRSTSWRTKCSSRA
jgi:putative lipoprotein